MGYVAPAQFHPSQYQWVTKNYHCSTRPRAADAPVVSRLTSLQRLFFQSVWGLRTRG
jgi:hypothetical protein